LRTVRSTYIQLGLALALAIVITALVAAAIGSTFKDLSETEQADFDPAIVTLIGASIGQIALIVFGVTLVSAEYTSGMIRQTLTTTPRLLQVLAAKALIILAVTLVIGAFVVFGSFAVGQILLGTYEGVPTSSLKGETLRAVVAGWLTLPMFPLIGAALGVLLRSTATAITTVLSIFFVPGILAVLLPDVIQRNVMRFLPDNASAQLMQIDADTASPLYLDIAPAAALVVLWLVAFGAAAALSITRRDV
jgi:ABC-type transport system involved in multi-copper enzyme maturation permease subunit